MTARLAPALGAALLLMRAAPELADAAQQVAAKGRASHLVRKKAIGRSAFLDGPHFELDGRGIK